MGLPAASGQIKPSATIVENAMQTNMHNTLVAAVKAADLVAVLSGPGPFTVFAPSNAAFAALLAELGIASGSGNDITQLRHVPSRAEKRAAEEIADALVYLSSPAGAKMNGQRIRLYSGGPS